MSAKPNMSVPTSRSEAPLRAISFGDPDVSIDRRDDGTIYLRPKIALGEYPQRLTDRLHHWAKAEPNRVFMAEREHGGGWRQITYTQLLTASRHIASALLARGLSAPKSPFASTCAIWARSPAPVSGSSPFRQKWPASAPFRCAHWPWWRKHVPANHSARHRN